MKCIQSQISLNGGLILSFLDVLVDFLDLVSLSDLLGNKSFSPGEFLFSGDLFLHLVVNKVSFDLFTFALFLPTDIGVMLGFTVFIGFCFGGATISRSAWTIFAALTLVGRAVALIVVTTVGVLFHHRVVF